MSPAQLRQLLRLAANTIHPSPGALEVIRTEIRARARSSR